MSRRKTSKEVKACRGLNNRDLTDASLTVDRSLVRLWVKPEWITIEQGIFKGKVKRWNSISENGSLSEQRSR